MAKLPGFFEGTEMPAAGWWEALWPSPATVLAAVGISSGMDVIDLCRGDGWFTLQIAKLAKRVVAIDIDRQLLDVARLRLAENGVTNFSKVMPINWRNWCRIRSTLFPWPTPFTVSRTNPEWRAPLTQRWYRADDLLS
jgi:SAM-dependent methyltransferase